MLPLAWRTFWLAGAVAIASFIVLGSLLPGPQIERYVVSDKLEHAAAYLVLTLWLTGIVERRRYWTVALIAAGVGALLELAQRSLTSTREPDWLDLAANLAGVVLAVALAYLALGGWAARIERWLGVVPRD